MPTGGSEWRGPRRFTVVVGTMVVVSTVVLTAIGTDASAAPTWPRCPVPPGLSAAWAAGDLRGKLWLNACGKTKVVRGTNYDYTVVLSNISKTTFRRLELSVFHYEPITHSSRPYRRRGGGVYAPMTEAVWTAKNFKPGQTFRVSIRLPFEQHNDPIGSNIHIAASTQGPEDIFSLTKDVFFIP